MHEHANPMVGCKIYMIDYMDKNNLILKNGREIIKLTFS